MPAAKCWFCDSTHDLREHTRSYDGAPYDPPQFICGECYKAELDYKIRCMEMMDEEYAIQEEHAARVRDSKEGF